LLARRALLIINAESRSGNLSLQTAMEQLQAHGIETVHHDCSSGKQLSPLIAEHGKHMDLVIIGGGDGTLNAAARGITKVNRPLGILPTGTANDLARTLGIVSDVAEAVRIIAEGHTRRIDLGQVNDHLFFNVASLGLSAELAQTLTRDVKRKFGKIGYVIAALRVLARARPFRAEIVSPKETVRVTVLQIAIGNGRYYGGGNAVEETAKIDDQRLDLYSLEFTRAWKLAIMARSFRYGEHGAWDEVRVIRATEFEIFTRRPRPINADGEIVTWTPARFSVVPLAIEVFAPKKA
jgi:YegS/Rv2252/BmrU family lipid kinase